GQLPLDVRADHADRPEPEVEHAGSAVDDDQALRGDRVERADAEPEECESDELLHAVSTSPGPEAKRAPGNRGTEPACDDGGALCLCFKLHPAPGVGPEPGCG